MAGNCVASSVDVVDDVEGNVDVDVDVDADEIQFKMFIDDGGGGTMVAPIADDVDEALAAADVG